MEKDFTRNMLNSIRNLQESKLSNCKNILKEDMDKQTMVNSEEKGIAITKNTPQFGDVRASQEDSLIKTIGEGVELSEDALMFYPDSKNMVLSGKITSLNAFFQFNFNDTSGDGCYIWANALQLTDTNTRTIGKLRDAFVNWKTSLLQNSDLLDKLQMQAKNKKI